MKFLNMLKCVFINSYEITTGVRIRYCLLYMTVLKKKIANFKPSFPDTFRLAPSTFRIEII